MLDMHGLTSDGFADGYEAGYKACMLRYQPALIGVLDEDDERLIEMEFDTG